MTVFVVLFIFFLYNRAMFNSLKGIVTQKSVQKVFVQTGGIEWDVTVPESSLEKLPGVGEEARIFVYLLHNETSMTLFGFATENDRSLFFDLLKVDGIGPKGAVKIMGSISTEKLAKILDEDDVDSLKKVPGVGAKTAGKIILQLKGKLFAEKSVQSSARNSVPFPDAVDALVQMGYDRKKAEEAVSRVAQKLSAEKEFSSASESVREDSVFRASILELSR